MHETEKVATVNAQRSNRQICCSRRHPLKRTETEISKKNKIRLLFLVKTRKRI